MPPRPPFVLRSWPPLAVAPSHRRRRGFRFPPPKGPQVAATFVHQPLLIADLCSHKLVFEDVLPDRTEVAYYAHGKKLLVGDKKDMEYIVHAATLRGLASVASSQGRKPSILTRCCLSPFSGDGGDPGALLRKLHLYNIERIDNASLSAALSAYPSLLDLEIIGLVKVKVPEQEEFVYPENDRGAWVFLKFIESLYFEEEKNLSKCPPSISKNTKAYPQHIIMRSTPATKGMLKNSKRIGESPKENARASSVIRPRAVLSSPDNDGLVGSMNDLNNNISSPQRQKGARGKIEAQDKILSNHVKVRKPSDRDGGAAFRGKTPLKVKCMLDSYLKRGHA
ncbi:hypothetical protein SESBI_31524 [Sesbania bispinosa]|nr:hypothetical protein SESBI_31524 [Sesbania bispinosa]